MKWAERLCWLPALFEEEADSSSTETVWLHFSSIRYSVWS